MSTAGGVIAGSEAAARDSAAWAAMRADGSIQFVPVPPPSPQVTPDWLLAVGRFLGRLLRPLGELMGLDWRWLLWTLITLAVVGSLGLVWALGIGPLLARRRAASPSNGADGTPDHSAALALLEDADRLAAQGRYGEAAHLLLERSVGQIGAARPGLLSPASTAREIGGAGALPERARAAFATLAEVVERSLFALRGAGVGDWRRARGAYTEFALSNLAADPR